MTKHSKPSSSGSNLDAELDELMAAELSNPAVGDADSRVADGSGGDSDEPADTTAPHPEADAIAEHREADGNGTHPDTALAAERLADLQRLQAEYVNYKRRVDRDRVAVQRRALVDVLEALLPTLDEIHLAREHGDLGDGPFKSIAEKLEGAVGKYGLESFGKVGEPFDPTHHEALMHAAWDSSNPELPQEATASTVVTVLQPGYRLGELVVRPARVAVADPQ